MRVDHNTEDAGLLAAEVRRLAAALDDATAEIARLRAEVERLRLTDAEREAIKSAICDYEANDMDAGCWQMASTLRALLARHGGDA